MEIVIAYFSNGKPRHREGKSPDLGHTAAPRQTQGQSSQPAHCSLSEMNPLRVRGRGRSTLLRAIQDTGSPGWPVFTHVACDKQDAWASPQPRAGMDRWQGWGVVSSKVENHPPSWPGWGPSSHLSPVSGGWGSHQPVLPVPKGSRGGPTRPRPPPCSHLLPGWFLQAGGKPGACFPAPLPTPRWDFFLWRAVAGRLAPVP